MRTKSTATARLSSSCPTDGRTPMEAEVNILSLTLQLNKCIPSNANCNIKLFVGLLCVRFMFWNSTTGTEHAINKLNAETGFVCLAPPPRRKVNDDGTVTLLYLTHLNTLSITLYRNLHEWAETSVNSDGQRMSPVPDRRIKYIRTFNRGAFFVAIT